MLHLIFWLFFALMREKYTFKDFIAYYAIRVLLIVEGHTAVERCLILYNLISDEELSPLQSYHILILKKNSEQPKYYPRGNKRNAHIVKCAFRNSIKTKTSLLRITGKVTLTYIIRI